MNKKILIAIPSTTHIWANVVTDLVQLVATTCTRYQLGYVNVQGALLPLSRDNCIKYALEKGFTHILFIDSDMRFPPDALIRLLDHDKDIIGCNAAKKDGTGPVIEKNIVGARMDAIAGNVTEVEGIGMAFTLINMEVFDKLSLPYFYIDYSEDGESTWGEDLSFCADIRTFGYEVYCDLKLSKQIGHLGEKEHRL